MLTYRLARKSANKTATYGKGRKRKELSPQDKEDVYLAAGKDASGRKHVINDATATLLAELEKKGCAGLLSAAGPDPCEQAGIRSVFPDAGGAVYDFTIYDVVDHRRESLSYKFTKSVVAVVKRVAGNAPSQYWRDLYNKSDFERPDAQGNLGSRPQTGRAAPLGNGGDAVGHIIANVFGGRATIDANGNVFPQDPTANSGEQAPIEQMLSGKIREGKRVCLRITFEDGTTRRPYRPQRLTYQAWVDGQLLVNQRIRNP